MVTDLIIERIAEAIRRSLAPYGDDPSTGHLAIAAAAVVEELHIEEGVDRWFIRKAALTPASEPVATPACQGFRWVGQSFASCDGCGQPYWEHECDTKLKPGAGPFDDEPFDYVPISDARRAAVRAKWEGT
jgi:hypothetical protein